MIPAIIARDSADCAARRSVPSSRGSAAATKSKLARARAARCQAPIGRRDEYQRCLINRQTDRQTERGKENFEFVVGQSGDSLTVA